MEPGDKVVFYTDGIVEAMNKKEEMFGFERLQEIIETSKADTAKALMNDIIQSVSDFAGQTPQHDDLTIIVVSANKFPPNMTDLTGPGQFA
jgi:serine phosphatase RsbU (regulator of sigma subunit)